MRKWRFLGGKKITALILSTALVLTTAGSQSAQVKGSTDASESETKTQQESATVNQEDFTNDKIETNYTAVSQGYTAPAYTGDDQIFKMGDVYQTGNGDDYAKLAGDTKDYTGADSAINLEINKKAVLKIKVPKTALYWVKFDYCSYDGTVLPASVGVKVNGEYPFYEARNLTFESTWQESGEIKLDRYGNQIVAIPEKTVEWESKYLMDANYRYAQALSVQLKEGENEIELNISEGNILVGNLTLCAPKLLDEGGNYDAADGDGFIEIQGEDFFKRNDSSIRAICEYNTNLDPYSVDDRVLNTIDSDAWKDAGQMVTYRFNVEKSGYYKLGINYRQNSKSDFPVFTTIKVDNEIPDKNFKNYSFAYNKDFEVTTLSTDGNDMSIHLDEGIHDISFTISAEPIRTAFETIEKIMNNINSLSLEITKVVGTNKDKYRDFDLEAYIPGLGDMLIGWADELDNLSKDMSKYNTDVKDIGALSSIGIASNQLRSLAKKPNELIYRIAELSTSTNSANQYLANEIDTLNKNNISFDRICLFQSEQKGNIEKKTGFFKSLTSSISRFFNSFSSQDYSASSADSEHLQVWVNRSRQYLEIMQTLIDEDFTPNTGIEVDLSLMPDQNKLILANASGDSPDVATGINYAQPFELGIRGAIKDLTEFSDYKEVLGQFNEGLLLPAVIDDSIYAIPETMNFWVLFYRQDILDKLGLEVPNTLDEVKGMLPDLQMRGMNFYYPTAGMVAMKNFHGTTPLLFQNGASLYGTDISKTTLSDENAVAGFKELTDLFTIYNMPKDIPSFYQHFRNGDIPIGIADFFSYNQLLNAAPEIANSWKISLVPGTVNEETNEVERYQCAGMDDIVMFKSNEERENNSWEFMKWWTSAEVQGKYGQMMQIAYGDEYMWSSANTEAFANLPWKNADKQVVLEQAKWITECPRVPGSYMAERELSNAYNSVVADGKTLRTTLDEAVKTINRETERKLEEFGYIKDGKVVKEYVTPTVEHIKELLGKK